ncbi:MAG TPA: M15 family metallopeptidase [Oscillospiraceae bacterium]|nr:M15 family metallopeptidase [Oscillospiraceae bacterium]
MKTGKTLGIFSLILLLMVLIVVVGARTRQETQVVMDGGTAPAATATAPATATGVNAAVPVPSPTPTETLPEVDVGSWELALVNKSHEVSGTPKVAEIGKTGAYFDARAVDALNSLISACKAAGYSPHINLAYVPESAQEYYFNKKAAEIADGAAITDEIAEKASRIVARPGQSEHQTGLAVDITDTFYLPYTSEQIDSDLLAWLVEHCAEYGFIQRYPAGKENITGWRESYHFRYVGVEAATYIMDHELCLEEFLALYK